MMPEPFTLELTGEQADNLIELLLSLDLLQEWQVDDDAAIGAGFSRLIRAYCELPDPRNPTVQQVRKRSSDWIRHDRGRDYPHG
jgi:hypothetical protein